MKSTSPSFLAEALRLVAVCPLCRAAAGTEANVLRRGEDAAVAHVTCRGCQMALLVRVEPVGMGVTCLAIVTDLSLADARRTWQQEAVVEDDVLSVHQSLTEGTFLGPFLLSADATPGARRD